MKKNQRLLVSAISLIVLFFLFYVIGLDKILTTLVNANLWYVAFAFSLVVFIVIMGAWNLFVLIKPLNVEISFKDILKYYFYGWVNSLYLPFKIGEYTTFLFLRKDNFNLGKGTAVFLIDKLITLIVTLIIAVVGFLIFFGRTFFWRAGLAVLLITICVIFGLSKFSRRLILKYFLKKYAKEFHGFSETFFSYFHEHIGAVFKNFMFTGIRTFLSGILAYIIFLAVGTKINLFFIIIVSAMEVLTELLPFTVNGLGVKQSLGIYLYSLQGINLAYVSARYIIGMIIRYTLGTLFIVSTHLAKKI